MNTQPKFNIGDEVYFFDPDYKQGKEIFPATVLGVRIFPINANNGVCCYYLRCKSFLNEEIEGKFIFTDKPLKELKENIISRTNQRIFFLREDIKELNDKLTIKKEYLTLEKQKITNLT